MAFKIIGLVAFAVFIILFVYMVRQVSRLRKRTQKELSFEPGVYQGPADDHRVGGGGRRGADLAFVHRARHRRRGRPGLRGENLNET